LSIEHNVTPEDLLAAAHGYRKRGWRVIPLHHLVAQGACSCKAGETCTSKGKHPLNNAWQKSPVPSGGDVQMIWETSSPGSNVGLAVGEPGGFWVLDIDPKGGGMDSMRDLVATHGKLPETFTVKTGSGGYHYYFTMPDFELRNSQGRVGPGIDTRASGGQVVAAPSATDKGVYTVIKDAPIVEAPAWLLEVARKTESTTPVVTAEDLPKPEDIEPHEWDRLNTYAERVVTAELERLDALKRQGWDGEPWDATTFMVACTLFEIANSPWNRYSLGQAESDVFNRAPRDDQGFDDYRVKQKISSARERVGDKARPVPASQRPDPGMDLFAGPDVRGAKPDPSEGGEAEGGPAAPNPERFFDQDKSLLAAALAKAILDEGPLGWGRNEDFWSYDSGVWRPDHHVVENRAVRLLANKFRTGHVTNVKPITRLFAYDIQADPHPDWMNFANGMLHWATGEMKPHDPDFRSTVQFPVAYEPEATCPTFDAFLADVMHEDYVELAWEMLGYLLFSGNPLQVAFLFYGSGGNGKGTLMRVIEDLLGRDNIASESLDDLNKNRFSAVNLYGRIANLAGDIDGTYQESTANFKKLTGEDTYAGEKKFGDRFNFESWAVPVFSANKIPGSADVTEGYLRRWVVLHFHKRIQNMIPGFSDQLSTELPGIAAKAVRALRVLMERERFDPRGEATKGKEEMALQIDQVRQWIASGEPMMAPDHWQSAIDLYAAYRIWAERSGQGKLREAEFSHRLEAIGYERQRFGGAVGHIGLHANLNPTQQHSAPETFFNG
jgi:putative DNA primase/helicase